MNRNLFAAGVILLSLGFVLLLFDYYFAVTYSPPVEVVCYSVFPATEIYILVAGSAFVGSSFLFPRERIIPLPLLVGLLWIALTVALYRTSNQIESAATIDRFGPGWFAVVILGAVVGFMLGRRYIKYVGRVSMKGVAKPSGLFLVSFAAIVIIALAVFPLWTSPTGLFYEPIEWYWAEVGLLDSLSSFAASIFVCAVSSIAYLLYRFSKTRRPSVEVFGSG